MNLDVVVTTSALIIPIEQIHPGVNARGAAGNVDALAMSIQAIGQQQPVIVENRPEGGYTLFDGHRRHKAMRQVGVRYVRAVLRSPVEGADRLIQQLAMSTTGKSFDPMAESDGVYELFWAHNLSQDEIARKLGHSLAWVRGRLALHQATPLERSQIVAGRLPVSQVLAAIGQRRAGRDGATPPTKTSPKSRDKAAPCPVCGGTGRAA